MATAKKTEPLSITDLMQAQRSLLKDRSLTEGQRKMAEQQLAKLEDLKKSFEASNEKVDADLKAITKSKGTSQQVSLGDVRSEMRGMRADLKALATNNSPTPYRAPAPTTGAAPPVTPTPAPAKTPEPPKSPVISTAGNRGNRGTLGDAFAAATGKKTVLKEGFGYDDRGEGSKVRDDKTGRFASIKNAGMGKFAGASTILGNFVNDKAGEFVESKRSEKIQKFMGNFKESDNVASAKEASAVPAAKGKPNLSVIQGGKSGAALSSATDGLKTQTINITAATVNLNSNKDKKGEGAVKEAPKKPAAEPKPVAKPPKVDAPAAKPAAKPPKVDAPPAKPVAKPPENPAPPAKPAPTPPGDTPPAPPSPPPANPAPATQPPAVPAAESGGSGLADIASEGLMSKAGGMLKGAKGGLIKGGVAALGGMALSAGGDMLKDAGHEKLGGAMDVAGEAATWGGTGAMIGSVVPGVGTAIGGAIGAAGGAAYGLYKNWGNFFGGDKKKDNGFGGRQGDDPDAPNYDADLASSKEDFKPGKEARATGGPVVEGKSYMVGEKGPETFTPSEDGKITPNGQKPSYGTKMSDIKGEATNSYTDENTGSQISDHEGGVKVKRHKDGTVEVSSGSGTSIFDANGKEIKSMSPSLNGYNEERDSSGNTTKNYNSGGLSVSETTDASGKFVKNNSSYDMGMVKLDTEQTAEQKASGQVNYKATSADGQIIAQGTATVKELEEVLRQSGQQPAPQQQAAPQPAAAAQPAPVLPRGSVRNDESALDRYNGRNAAFH